MEKTTGPSAMMARLRLDNPVIKFNAYALVGKMFIWLLLLFS
jgi:hypothetical protein